MVLLGTLSGLVWYYFAYSWMWRRINPIVVRYSLQPVTILSYVLFGLCLGYLGRRGSSPIPAAELAAIDSRDAGRESDEVE